MSSSQKEVVCTACVTLVLTCIGYCSGKLLTQTCSQYSAVQYSTVEYNTNTVYCVQGSFPTATNLSSATLQLARGTTPLARRTYLETTDQEMDVWIKLQLSTLAGAR